MHADSSYFGDSSALNGGAVLLGVIPFILLAVVKGNSDQPQDKQIAALKQLIAQRDEKIQELQ